MALNVPDEGENYALEAFVNKTAATNPVAKLYKNNMTQPRRSRKQLSLDMPASH
jgi:hypothetical protein